MAQPSVVGIAGSLRDASYNKRLLAAAMTVADSVGATTTTADLKKLDLPLYNKEIEDGGFPDGVRDLRETVKRADVLVIASPEYNHSVTGVLKNAIDWASRPPNAFNGGVAAIMGASPSRMGTVRSQLHLREILAALNVTVVPKPELMISNVDEAAFTDDHTLADEKAQEILEKIVENALDLYQRLDGSPCDAGHIES